MQHVPSSLQQTVHLEPMILQEAPSLPQYMVEQKEALLSCTAGKEIHWSGVASFLHVAGRTGYDVITNWIDLHPHYNIYDFITAVASEHGGNNLKYAQELQKQFIGGQLKAHDCSNRHFFYDASKHSILGEGLPNRSGYQVEGYPIVSERVHDDSITKESDEKAIKKTAITPLKRHNNRRSSPQHRRTPYTKSSTQSKQMPVLTSTLLPPLESVVQLYNLKTISPAKARSREVWYQAIRPHLIDAKWRKLGETFIDSCVLDNIQVATYEPDKTIDITQRDRMDYVCHNLCDNTSHTLAFIIEKLEKLEENLTDSKTSHSRYTGRIQNALTALNTISKRLLEGENEAVSLSKRPPSPQASPQSEVVALKHATITDTDALCTSEGQPSSQTTEGPDTLNATQRKYYDCIMSTVSHRAWLYIAQQFMEHTEIMNALSCAFGFGHKVGGTLQRRMHTACILMIQRLKTKDKIIECLTSAVNDKRTPAIYTASIKSTANLLQKIS